MINLLAITEIENAAKLKRPGREFSGRLIGEQLKLLGFARNS
jgi:hypothetical protein